MEQGSIYAENVLLKRDKERDPLEALKKSKVQAFSSADSQHDALAADFTNTRLQKDFIPIEPGSVTKDYFIPDPEDQLDINMLVKKSREMSADYRTLDLDPIEPIPIEEEAPICGLLQLEPLSDSDFDV